MPLLLPYPIREGLAGFRRARFASVAATSAMAVALVLIGLLLLLVYQGQEVTTLLQERVGELELFLEAVEAPMAKALEARAAAMPGVDRVEYISPEQAQEIFRREFGEGSEVYQGELFLPASIKVFVERDYANSDSLNALKTEFESWNRVESVAFNEDLLVKVQQNLRYLHSVGLVLGVIVMLASVFLVANTIRLTIYARRLLIRTMKLVGATDAFVRRPFIVEGLAQGLAAGVLASLLLWGLYRLVLGFVPALALHGFGPLLTLFLVLIGCGLLLGWLGSWFSVRRFIREVALH
jgi:cell division transport system permease protein